MNFFSNCNKPQVRKQSNNKKKNHLTNYDIGKGQTKK